MAKKAPAKKPATKKADEPKVEVVEETKAEVVETPEPVVEEKQEVVETPTQEEVVEEKQEVAIEPTALETITKDVPAAFTSIAHMLGEYIDGMAPNVPQTVDSIHSNQMKLRAIINSVLNMKEENFEAGMKGLITAVREYRTKAFSERLIFRGFAQLRIPRAERQKIESIVSLLLAAADSKNPKNISNVVDLDVVLRHVSDNGHQQKLQSYFS